MIKRILSLFFICIFSVQNLFAFGSKTHKALTTFAAQKATTNNYQILKYLQ